MANRQYPDLLPVVMIQSYISPMSKLNHPLAELRRQFFDGTANLRVRLPVRRTFQFIQKLSDIVAIEPLRQPESSWAIANGLRTDCFEVSTVSFNPTALVTPNRVESRGFPRADKTRYRLSRSMPAALATLAMPPRASAMRRRAIRSTLGSSSSSKAARRHSAANSGLSRSSRIVASSCDMPALRFIVSLVQCNL